MLRQEFEEILHIIYNLKHLFQIFKSFLSETIAYYVALHECIMVSCNTDKILKSLTSAKSA